MRWPRARLTLKSMMVVVAIIACSIWAWIQVEARRTHFRQLVGQYNDKRGVALSFSYSGPAGAVMEERLRVDAIRRAKASAYYSELIQKYERAARYPWLPVAADTLVPRGIDNNSIVVK